MSLDTRVEPHEHVVLFYEDAEDLTNSVCQYLVEGLQADEVAVVVATAAHTAAFESSMRRAGVDVAMTRSERRLITFDAEQAMSRFLVDDWPQSSAFFSQFGELIRDAGRTGRPVRVYGEMVAVLWDLGHVAAAIELESLWNDLSQLVPFELFCAYPSHMVSGDENEASFNRICECHSEVLGEVTPRTPDVVGAADRSEATRSFPCDSRALSACRTFVAKTLSSWQLDHVVEDACIVVSELATNAVLHAHAAFSVSVVRQGGSIRVSVRDSSPDMPVLGSPSPTTVTGRGLLLVNAIARGWGIEVDSSGKLVWAELGT
jgi:anti-sigma regulatory factor (Ser/Thr protein kinase)